MRHCRQLNPAEIFEDVKDLLDELRLSVGGLVGGLDVDPGECLVAVILGLVPEIPEHGSVLPSLHLVEDKTILVMVDHVSAATGLCNCRCGRAGGAADLAMATGVRATGARFAGGLFPDRL